MDPEVPEIWGDVAATSTNQERITVLTQYLLTGMELCQRDFHGHAQLLYVGGGGVFNFIAGDLFVNLGTKPACPAGRFSVWKCLKRTEDVGTAIYTSDADMAALDGRKYQADHIFRAAHMVLWVIVGTLTMQREVDMCCYLLHRLLGNQSPLVEALRSQVVNVIDKDFYLFAMQM